MSDYGYRPAPPPEDGRPQGHGAGQPDGRAYGNAPGGSGGRQGDSDYGWGGGSQQQGGGYGQAPRPRQQPYGTPPSGQAPVGRGSASVGRPTGSASVGRPTGSASVGGATGSASVGGAGRTGRASVGSASVGSASVGSASVGSASVGSASVGDFDSERTGRASVTGARRAGKGPLNKSDLEAEGGKKKRKRLGRKMLAAMIAMGVLFIAGVTIVGSYFFVTVDDPGSISRAGESSSFYFSDGTQAGGYGETLRLQAEENEIPKIVKDALIATEDRKFRDHSGVDFTRTMGALVNNLSGGDTQGASTITQQYAGMVMAIRNEISYDRKAKEAAMAIKMEQEYSKDEIITAYLNLAWYGRGATGIEAAAKVYFNKGLNDLTPGEAAYIIMQVKSPDGTYDPYYEDVFDPEATQARWDYSMGAMLEEDYITQKERDAEEMPVPIDEFNSAGSWGGNTNVGFIINELDGYVFDELQTRYGLTKADLYGGKEGKGGGYSVTLTIDPTIQNQLAATGSRGEIAVDTNEAGEFLNEAGEVVATREEAKKDLTSEGYAQFENTNEEAALEAYEKYMMTAMVAIDPETGDIVGYYGGDNGFGVDKAGPESPHPSSSTFKMITAATAISEGDSIDSWFNADSPRKFDSLTDNETEQCIGGGEYPNCTLRNGSQDKDLEMQLTDAVRDSKNTPMYSIAEKYGAFKVLDYADKMGLSFMSQARSLTDSAGKTWDDRSVNYQFYDDGTYSQHGMAVDAKGEPVTDGSGNWNTLAPVQVDGDCNPIVNTEGYFIQTEDERPVPCPIGDKGDTDPFYNHIAFGQYPTSVRDMASVYATIANDGVYNESHFVAEVKDNKGNVVEEINPLTLGEQAIDSSVAQDLQWVGSEIGGESETDQLSRDYFGKTGTWEASCEECESSWNAHAWYVGAIPQLSIAAWVGNVTSESDPIADPNGDKSNVFGSNTAYPVWFKAMEGILEATGWEEESWEGKANAGNETWWDIEKAGVNEGGQFCAAKPDNELCASQQEEEETECEDGENGNNGGGNGNQEECETPPEDGASPSTDPSEDPSTDDECDAIIPPPSCNEESTDPEEGMTSTPEEGDNNNGNG
ncbi:transglycosylase domain-containing protein [Glycomyces rhizosphaerae]|uniref:Transglycosylase domain-containing protein n=1 Tax=Glycomyces rhizosphaerae TaxID=2054422 RepID=A0ABV7PWU2_9ACTN